MDNSTSSNEGGFFNEAEDDILITQMTIASDIILPLSKNDGCMFCGSVPIEKEVLATFNIHVCYTCNRKQIKLITKTTCKSNYMLSDEELKNFKFLTRPNPHKGSWNDMQLYLESEIKDYSCSKYGSLENIEKVKEERKQVKKQSKMKKIKQKVKELKKKTFLAPIQQRHVHKFVCKGKYSVCDCGMQIEEEEL